MTDPIEPELDLEDEQEEETELTEWIEYLGEAPYGTSFLTSHTLPATDGLWKRNKVKVDSDLVWERDPSLPVGQPGNRMFLATDDIPAEAQKVLEDLPQYQRVSE